MASAASLYKPTISEGIQMPQDSSSMSIVSANADGNFKSNEISRTASITIIVSALFLLFFPKIFETSESMPSKQYTVQENDSFHEPKPASLVLKIQLALAIVWTCSVVIYANSVRNLPLYN